MKPLQTPILTRDQVRDFDRIAIEEFGMHPLVLMENAARGAVERLCEAGIKGSAVICCGHGNNGGDGLAMARHLHLRGHRVKVLLFGDLAQLSQDARANLRILMQTSVAITGCHERDLPFIDEQLADHAGQEPEWIVDALLGTGAQPPVRAPLDQVIPLLNNLSVRRMAVDIPTGLDCDSDRIAGPVFRADLTCTFVASKPVFQTATGREYAGIVKIVDIGAPPEVFDVLLPNTSDH